MVLCATHHVFTPSPAWGALIVIALAVVFVAYWARDVRRHPDVPWCPRCKGTGRSRSTWNPEASGVCPKCGGKPMRRRTGAGPQ